MNRIQLNKETQSTFLLERKQQDTFFATDCTLEFNVTIAKLLGINAAIVLYELDRLLESSPVMIDGYKWYRKTYDHWQLHFPFWSTRTIMRTILRLEENGYIIATRKYNDFGCDTTKWYRIDYEKIEALLVEWF